MSVSGVFSLRFPSARLLPPLPTFFSGTTKSSILALTIFLAQPLLTASGRILYEGCMTGCRLLTPGRFQTACYGLCHFLLLVPEK